MKKRIIAASIAVVLICCLCLLFSGCDLLDSIIDGSAQQKDVTITLDPNGGTVGMLTIKGKSGDTMDLPTPIKDGYEFAGWYNGYSTVSQNEFPDKDMTLTARYYAQEDSVKTTVYQTELNKEYANTKLSFTRDSFDVPTAIDYLVENHNVDIDIVINLEAYIDTIGAGEWLGTDGKLTLTGANSNDVLDKVTISNYNYKTHVLSAKIKSSYLYANGTATIMTFEGRTSYGSSSLKFRNMTIKISYTEKAGTLV